MHATHVYNRTPIHRLKWDTSYTLLNGKAPDISHLKVFGCSTYMHIPKKMHANGLAPKSELIAYLGHTEGIKVCAFQIILSIIAPLHYLIRFSSPRPSAKNNLLAHVLIMPYWHL